MRVLLVSAVRDEAPHLPEWIAHHRALGVTDFLIFSNDCGDGTDAMLDAMAPLGVTHLPNRPAEGKSVQWNALVRSLAGYHLYRSKYPAGEYAREALQHPSLSFLM